MYLYSIINYYEELRDYLETTVPVFAGFVLKVIFAILVYWVGARIIDTVTGRSTKRMLDHFCWS